jgi:hypothetical protein
LLPKINEDENYKNKYSHINHYNNEKPSLKTENFDEKRKRSVKLIDKKTWFKDKYISQPPIKSL